MISNFKRNAGFTLIEMIVVMAVFLFIIGGALGIFLSVVQSQKRLLSEQQFLNQISYVEEYMSKALRMAATDDQTTDPVGDGNCVGHGYIYLLTRYNTNTGFFTGIKFLNQSDDNACQEFYLDVASLTDPSLVLWEMNTNNGSSPVALTPTNLQINSVRFSIDGSDGSANEPSLSQNCLPSQCGTSDTDTVQPRVTILLNVTIPGDNQSVGASCSADTCPSGEACDMSIHKCSPTRVIQTTVSQRNLNVNHGQR